MLNSKPLEQIGNNLFRDSNKTMYRHALQPKSVDVMEEGVWVTKTVNISKGLVRLTPRKHKLKTRQLLKADGTKKRLKKWAR